MQADDSFYPDRITHRFKKNSLYYRRFHQRRRLRKLLGKHGALVGVAKSSTKEDFLKRLTVPALVLQASINKPADVAAALNQFFQRAVDESGD